MVLVLILPAMLALKNELTGNGIGTLTLYRMVPDMMVTDGAMCQENGVGVTGLCLMVKAVASTMDIHTMDIFSRSCVPRRILMALK